MHIPPRTGIIGSRGPNMTDIDKIAHAFISALPHAAALGMQITSIGDGVVVMTMPWDARFVGDPATGVLHGGAVSALMDSVGGMKPSRPRPTALPRPESTWPWGPAAKVVPNW